MIYQVKGISGYVWDMHGCVLVCVGVCGCARVCSGVLRCARVCAGVHGRAQVHAKVHTCMWVWLGGWVWYARVCMGVCGSVRKCEGVCKCVCWMNFQNIFWRLDSIHQRTLIRILYEFLFSITPKQKNIYLWSFFYFSFFKKLPWITFPKMLMFNVPQLFGEHKHI